MGTIRFDRDQEEIRIFLAEMEENLAQAEDSLLNLEQGGSTSSGLNEIFRAFHTIKGSAAALGYDGVARLAHAAESVLEGLRKGSAGPSPELVDILLCSIDRLRSMMAEISGGNDPTEDEDLGALVSRLAMAGGTEEQVIRRVAVDDGDRDIPVQPAEKVGAGGHSSLGAREELIEITVTFDEECPMPAVRAYQALARLSEIGRVIESTPTAEEIELERVGNTLHAVASTPEPAPRVQEFISAIPDVVLVQVRELPGLSGKPEVDRSEDQREKMTTIRISVERLDNLMNLIGELVIERTRVTELTRAIRSSGFDFDGCDDMELTVNRLERVVSQLQREVMKARMLPIARVFRRFPRMVRDLARKTGKEVELVISGEETELDRAVIEELSDPLIHLLRNAVDHGIELPDEREKRGKPRQGRIDLCARYQEDRIVVEVSDDGGGIDVEKLKRRALERGIITKEMALSLDDSMAAELIFVSGVSTSDKVNDVSGRGVGMDIVRNKIQRIGGSVDVSNSPGRGTSFFITLPLTLAIIKGLLVRVGDGIYVIPLSSVVEIVRLSPEKVKTISGRAVAILRGQLMPLLNLKAVLEGMSDVWLSHEARQMGEAERYGSTPVVSLLTVVLGGAGQRVGLVVDSLVGEQEVVVKALSDVLGRIPYISGATILGDGRIALILDGTELLRRATRSAERRGGLPILTADHEGGRRFA